MKDFLGLILNRSVYKNTILCRIIQYILTTLQNCFKFRMVILRLFLPLACRTILMKITIYFMVV